MPYLITFLLVQFANAPARFIPRLTFALCQPPSTGCGGMMEVSEMPKALH